MKRVSLFLFILVLLCSCGEKHYNEWVEENGNKYYYDEKGEMVKNCYDKIGSDTYVFNEEGAVIKDRIVNLDGKPSFVDSDGKLRYHGWCSSNGNWYYIDKSVLQTGWIKDQGNWYYLDPNYYYMLRNQWIDNQYYVNENGEMLISGWHKVGGQMLYFESDGKYNATRNYEQEIAAQQRRNNQKRSDEKELDLPQFKYIYNANGIQSVFNECVKYYTSIQKGNKTDAFLLYGKVAELEALVTQAKGIGMTKDLYGISPELEREYTLLNSTIVGMKKFAQKNMY